MKEKGGDTKMKTSEERCSETLQELLNDLAIETRPLGETGWMTNETGFEITLDGSKYLVTIQDVSGR